MATITLNTQRILITKDVLYMAGFEKLEHFDVDIKCNNTFEDITEYPQGLSDCDYSLPEGERVRSYTIPDGFDSVGMGAVTIGASAVKNNMVDGIGEIEYTHFNDKAPFRIGSVCTPKYLREIYIPEGVEVIKEKAFMYARLIERVHFPKSLKVIKEHAFLGCKSLKELEFSGDELTLCWASMWGLTSLKKVTFGAKNIRINSMAFNNCTSLEEIVITPDVQSITFGPAAFFECRSIRRVTLPEGLKLCYNIFDFTQESPKLRDIRKENAKSLPKGYFEREDDFSRIENIEFTYTDSCGNEISRVKKSAEQMMDEIIKSGEEIIDINFE